MRGPVRRRAALAGGLAAGLLALWVAGSPVAGLGQPAPARAGSVAASAESGQAQLLGELDAIRALMRQSLEALGAGDRETAFQLAREAYLSHFELVEIPLRVMDPEFTLEMEYRFAQWRNRIRAGASVADVEATVRDLQRGLEEAQALLEGPGRFAPTLAVLASFSILFREGLEAILVVAALLAYVRARHPSLQRSIWLGTGLAVPASLATWFVVSGVLQAAAPLGRELLEALLSLVAAAMMLYVTLWLFEHLETRQWMEFLEARVWGAMTAGNTRALALLAFVAVYREGAETVLFYQALLWMADRLESWVLLGIGLGAAALVAIGLLILYAGARLPLRAFLAVAMALLMVISVGLVGNAVRELQEAGVLQVTLVAGAFPRINRFVADLMGLYPTRETLLAQGVLSLVYLLGALYAFWWQPRRRAA